VSSLFGGVKRDHADRALEGAVDKERAELQRAKQDFLAAASHYISTPLTAMVGFAELLRDRSRDSSAGVRNQLIELLALQADETARVVRNLLTSAQFDMGEIVVEREAVDLYEAAVEAAETWQSHQRARLTITGSGVAVADHARTVQILHNLMTHAGDLGSSRVNVVISRGMKRVLVELTADGNLLPEEAKARIFDPYYTHMKQDGMPPSLGLGLSVARRLARAMGGEVDFHSADGENVFQLALPSAMGHEVADRAELVVDPLAGRPTRQAITEMLASDGFHMAYQAVAHLPSHASGEEQIIGYESLARFPHSTPPEWFETAGHAGLRLDLELATIRASVAGFAAAHGFLAVNLSDATLTSTRLLEALEGVDPGRVVLELSEVALVRSYEATNRVVSGLAERGIRLAIDDVGTGEIDLWNILRLEPAMIKIDMSLVRDLENSPRNGALIRGLAAMAGDLGVVVVAEGVETVRERDRLLELGVEHGQGYLFGKPQPLQWHTRVLGTG
jgi:EAL domain-containing protein (putative c-di-GMP-specific phosphodiesterase class I)